MKIDRDFIPLALIAALVVVWFSSKPWADATAIAIAGDALKVGLGGILGYLTKTSLTEESEGYLQELEAENERLRAQVNESSQA